MGGKGRDAAARTGDWGATAAGNAGNMRMQGAQMQGNQMAMAGTARASGYAGVGNAMTGAAGNWMNWMMR